MATATVYKKLALTAGGATSLDGIDGALLLDGDMCFTTIGGYLYTHILDDDAGGTESSPTKITPDTNPGTKRWILQDLVLQAPALGTPASGVLTNCTGLPLTGLATQPVLTNLLTNSQFMAMSGSTLCEVTSGAAPVTDGANAALVNNLLTNGGFDSVTTGWDANECTLASVAGRVGGTYDNVLQMTRTGSTEQHARQSIVTVSGKLYQASFYVKSGTSGDEAYTVRIYDTANGAILKDITGTSSGSWVLASCIFEAAGSPTTIYLKKMTSTAGTMLFDSITLYEVTPGYVAADTLAMDGWYKDSTLDVYRQHNDATYTKSGSFYAAKCVNGAADDYIKWPATDTEATHIAKFKGRTVTAGMWVLTATSATHVYLRLGDGVTNTNSAYHSGGGAWEWIEVTKTVSTSATRFALEIYFEDNPGTAYFSQPMLVYGSSIGQGNFQPIVNEVIWLQTKFNSALSGTGKSDVSAVTYSVEADSSGKIGKGVKALLISGGVNDSGSAAATDDGQVVFDRATTTALIISAAGLANDAKAYGNGWINCDSNGDLRYAFYATGAATLDTTITYNAIQT